MKRKGVIMAWLAAVSATAVVLSAMQLAPNAFAETGKHEKASTKPAKAAGEQNWHKSEAEWKKILTPQQFEVTRHAGTERAYTGDTWDNHKPGIYRCVDCGLELFSSKTKFESGTGWPSFWAPIAKNSVKNKVDTSFGETRTEVVCPRCDAHLGHVFEDGPPPTHLRFCMNSAAMKFAPEKKAGGK